MKDPFFQEKNAPKPAASHATASQTEERRASERIPFCETAEVDELGSGIKLQVRISDLNHQGCYVDSMHVFPRGAKVNVAIHRAGLDFKTTATVVYSLAGLGMGLNFSEASPEMESILRKWVGNANPAVDLEQTQTRTPAPAAPGKERVVLRSLVDLMVRKRLLTPQEGGELVQQLLKD